MCVRVFKVSLQASWYLLLGVGRVMWSMWDRLTTSGMGERRVWGRARVIIVYVLQMQCQARRILCDLMIMKLPILPCAEKLEIYFSLPHQNMN